MPTQKRSTTLKPLNAPRPLEVTTDARGRPKAVRKLGWDKPRAITHIQDVWKIDDEWWRERPISRLYFTVVVTGDHLLTICHDLIGKTWFEQHD